MPGASNSRAQREEREAATLKTLEFVLEKIKGESVISIKKDNEEFYGQFLTGQTFRVTGVVHYLSRCIIIFTLKIGSEEEKDYEAKLKGENILISS